MARQFLGIGDGCREKDELRGTSVMTANPLKPSKYLSDVAAKYSAICVQFIDHYEAQSLPEGFPLAVKRKQSIMEHVRVRQEDMGMILADFRPLIWGGVAIIDGSGKA
ncbi:MAG: hypothetical protein HGB17_12170 [Syntrophobacteraceae bacterium]|nr:hypothetical protein [Syntrophobacteraceae bacterium]